MSRRIEALVIVETNRPFNGLVVASIIEKHNGGYSKRTVTWKDRSLGRRNFYYTDNCESACDGNEFFIPPQFYSFTKLTNDILPIDVCLCTSPSKFKTDDTSLHFLAREEVEENPNWTNHLKAVKRGNDNFSRILRNIQAVSSLIDKGQRRQWFQIVASKGYDTPTQKEIANFEAFRTEPHATPCIEYVIPVIWSNKNFARKITPDMDKQQKIVRLYNTLSDTEKQMGKLNIPLEQIEVVAPIQNSTAAHTPQHRYHLTEGYSHNNMHIVDVPESIDPIVIEYRDAANPRRNRKYKVARGEAEKILASLIHARAYDGQRAVKLKRNAGQSFRGNKRKFFADKIKHCCKGHYTLITTFVTELPDDIDPVLATLPTD